MRYMPLILVAIFVFNTGVLLAQEPDTGTDVKVASVDDITSLIDAKKFDEAAKALDQSELSLEDRNRLRQSLMNAYARLGNAEGAYKVAKAMLLENLDQRPDTAMLGLTMVGAYAPRARATDDALKLTEQALTHFASANEEKGIEYEFTTATVRAQLLVQAGRTDEATELNASYLSRAEAMMAEQPASSKAFELVFTSLQNLIRSSKDEEKKSQFRDRAVELVKNRLAGEPSDDENFVPRVLQQYIGMMLSEISRLSRQDPERAATLLAETRELISKSAEGSDRIQTLEKQYSSSFSRIESTIASALKLAKLVGSPAPAIEGKVWVNGEATSLEELAGKVVMLDFWAVWCGPCIATFPHLREWNEEFGPQGLQIVGITRKYGYQWDGDKGRAVRAEGEVSDEQEAEMLEQFLAHHELQHPTVVTPEGSEVHSEYGVTGIPHAVLIDKKGIVRMVKVGSGEANAKALHDMIVDLLAE